MIIKYIDAQNEEVTLEQASRLNEYSIVYLVNNQPKKGEHFKDGKLTSIYYTRGENETDAEILREQGSNGVSIAILERSSLENGCEFIRSMVYDASGNHIMKFNSLYSADNELIAEEYVDLETGQLNYQDTVKYFYNRDLHPEKEVFESRYKPDGSLDHIRYNTLSDSRQFLENGTPGVADIPALCACAGTTMEQIGYYLRAEILPDN